MTVYFTFWFKTPALCYRLDPLFRRTLPGWFDYEPRVGIPRGMWVGPEGNEVWAGFSLPTDPGNVYIFDDEIPATAVGGGISDAPGVGRAAIRVRPEDPDDVLAMRMWHELLHAVDQPADDMHILAGVWLMWWERPIWAVWPYLFRDRDVPFWHRRYYRWLTATAIEEESHRAGGVVATDNQ